MRISLGDVSLWFDVSGPSVIPQGDTTVERPVLVAVHGGPGLDHMTVKSAAARPPSGCTPAQTGSPGSAPAAPVRAGPGG